MDSPSHFVQEERAILPASPEIEIFANALDDCLEARGTVSEKRSRILKLVDVYHRYASDRYRELLGRQRMEGQRHTTEETEMDVDDAGEQHDPLGFQQELQNWKQELETWDLLRHVLPVRYPEAEPTRNRTNRSSAARQAHPDLWHDFAASKPSVVERKSVLQWLQSTASAGPDINDLVEDLQKKADRGDIIAHGWIHTRASIKLRKSVLSWPRPLDPSTPELAHSHLSSSKSPLVTQLDPDSRTRQERRLEPQDEYFERAIWLGCFELLRRGSTADQIRDWCQERTEGWRAISMSALSVCSQDPAHSSDISPEPCALWRRACLAIARQGGTDDFERAVYGILGGDIPTVERVCKTWDDFVFAHYNALLRSEFDSFVLSRCTPETAAAISQHSFPIFDAVQYHGDPATLEKRLVRSLESNSMIAPEARSPMKVLQGAILAKDLEGHFFEQGGVLALQANRNRASKLLPSRGLSELDLNGDRFFHLDQHHSLRLLSHIYIILSQLESLYPQTGAATSLDPTRRDTQQNTIVAYASVVRLSGFYQLVPLYCSTLHGPRQYEILCRALIHTVEKPLRELEISLIRKAGLDPLKFVKTQAKLQLDAVLDTEEPQAHTTRFRIVEDVAHTAKYGRPVKADFFTDDPEAIDRPHEFLIRSVEWLLLVDQAWPDVFSMGTRVYKYLLKNMHLNAARAFAQRVSCSDFIRVRFLGGGNDDLELPDLNDVSFWAQQLSAMPAFSGTPAQVATDVRNFRELECLVRALDTMETLASLKDLAKESPNKPRDFWNKVGAEVKTVKDHMEPLLGGWLLAGIQEGDAELAHLRSTYLPETILAYVSTLHFAGTCLSRDNLLECMELAAVVADRDSDIAACFVQARRMRELVEAFASCSKALAVVAGEKKGNGTSSKRLRETGWSRDLWSVQSAARKQ